ncbi:AAA family ATPase [Maricaulis maris]|uniref:AAA family ATPase n=1 Tax=Maricaulis maris TaxID=74318 RepID=UPI003A950E73
MVKSLLEWAGEQEPWVSDSLRRIAGSTNQAITKTDFEVILENIRAAAGMPGAKEHLSPLEPKHLENKKSDVERTVLTQLGPVENIDRLARGQSLRMAPEGITLIYGENGSGKSGYTRIAKKLCRSLSGDDLRGNVFEESQEPKRVQIRYRVGEEEVRTIDWDASSEPPAALKQISIFDSQNARLYVDADNKIAYLPHDLAILERHGELCRQVGEKLSLEAKELTARLKVPLPSGYSAGSTVSNALGNLRPNCQELPSPEFLEELSRLSAEEIRELKELEAELSADPIAQADIRRRAIALLERVLLRLNQCTANLSVAAADSLVRARDEFRVASRVEALAASEAFSDEPLPNVGESAWRTLFDAARAFAVNDGGEAPDRLRDSEGDYCVLCQEPLSASGADRLRRFNDFVCGEAAKNAERANQILKSRLEEIERTDVPNIEAVQDSLSSYKNLNAQRQEILRRILDTFRDLSMRKAGLLHEGKGKTELPQVNDLVEDISKDVNLLKLEVAEFEAAAKHTGALDEKRRRLSSLKDRAKLGLDLEIVRQRLQDVMRKKYIDTCLSKVGTRTISNQTTALRKALVTEKLEESISSEIKALDLTHLPFRLRETSPGGQSAVSIGLQGVSKIKNREILSEGEQRALALACFLAEISDEKVKYGILVDDPVSSLDHLRVRKVARRLVAEACKGRQVVIFTHNIVFFNEVISEAARMGELAPLVKTVVRKTDLQGFGVIHEDSEPWVADIASRITSLQSRANELADETDFDTDQYRRKIKDFYTDLRESWERAVEEVVLAKTVVRFVPDVMTGRLRDVEVTDDDYAAIYHAMKRASERSGHDMSEGRDLPPPRPSELKQDLNDLDTFRRSLKERRKKTSARRELLEKPQKAKFIE